MFFRFGVGLLLVVLTSLAGTTLEKRNLEFRRQVSRQQYRLEILLEQQASNRVLAQQLGAPSRLVDKLDSAASADKSSQPEKPNRSNAGKARRKTQPAGR